MESEAKAEGGQEGSGDAGASALLAGMMSALSFLEGDSMKKLESLKCPICLDSLIATTSAECGHRFCGFCIETWLVQNLGPYRRCPVCLVRVVKDLKELPEVDKEITELYKIFPEEFQARRIEAIKDRKELLRKESMALFAAISKMRTRPSPMNT